MAKRKKITPKKKAKTKGPSDKLMEKLKNFIHTRAEGYLTDKNISSVGIGYKIKDNKPTDQLAIQFTVDQKVGTDLLEALDTTEIPKKIKIEEGLEIPTDVIQRSYAPSFKLVTETTPDERKTRMDPVAPGVSVGNIKITAGTIGCIVYDKDNGTPYILSNWHVLNGPDGVIGDPIVQPGKHDDNRIQLNGFGKLVRSYLGAAGDCAIASIDERNFKPEIFGLNVAVEQLAEPELGDKLIKSGRTTGITHGIVSRVHTLVKINYGGATGEKSIGGFEITPDPNKLPDNGEISMGGDSGSVWMVKSSNGKPTKMMAGLHFAGESIDDPNEHAIACYAKSVFEKLNVTLESQPAVTTTTTTATTATLPPASAGIAAGYNKNFLGVLVNTPQLSSTNKAQAFKLNGSEVIHYTHFSLTLNRGRKFAFWVAWNIDGASIKKLSRTGIKFDFDKRIPNQYQAGDSLYANNRLDRGHIARRADLVWGKTDEAKRANIDSFFFTNITPQMDDFNQGKLGGIWGKLEDAIFEDVDVDNIRVSVFGGPVFRSDDRLYKGFKIPREFFKVIVFKEAGKLKARGFLLTQNLNQLEVLDLSEFKTFQVKLTEIEQRCGFNFPDNLKSADGFAEKLEAAAETLEERQPVNSLSEIVW